MCNIPFSEPCVVLFHSHNLDALKAKKFQYKYKKYRTYKIQSQIERHNDITDIIFDFPCTSNITVQYIDRI